MTKATIHRRSRSGIPAPMPSETRVIGRCLLLSVVLHAVMLTLLLVRTGKGLHIPAPVRIISVDLADFGPVPRKPMRPTAQPRPRAVPAYPAAPARRRRAAIIDSAKTGSPSPEPPAAPTASQAAPGPEANRKAAVIPAGSGGREMSSPQTPPAAAPPEAIESLPPRREYSSSVRSGYLKKCRQLIELHKEYPLMARKSHREGTVLVHVVLKRDGSLLHCDIRRASGHTLLDHAALRSVRSVGRFPPFPPEVDDDELVFQVPVTFTLSND